MVDLFKTLYLSYIQISKDTTLKIRDKESLDGAHQQSIPESPYLSLLDKLFVINDLDLLFSYL